MKSRNKRLIIIKSILLICFICFSGTLAAQEIVTASEYFSKVSKKYGKITDYEAEIVITQEEEEMTGVIYYKNPHLIRINFENPKDQVLTVNGESLIIYIPKYQVILEQDLPKRTDASIASMANSQGLNFLRDYYRVSFSVGPEPIPLDEDSDEMVVKLKFIWRDTAEGFKEIIISFTSDGLIRRIKGKKAITNDYVQFDFKGVKINTGIPDERFDYDPPPYANAFKNFLFEENN